MQNWRKFERKKMFSLQKFTSKIKQNFFRKLKCCSKINIFFENQSFGQKLKFCKSSIFEEKV